MDVSIVIVSHNVANFLNECLMSIRKETTCKYEVIVVDNNSKDNSVDIVKAAHPEIKLIQNQSNIGFAKANNKAFRLANGRYIFMLNPDTMVLEKAIDKLVQFMDDNPEAGVCGPKNLNPDLSLQPNCHHFPTLSMVLVECLQLRRFFPKNRFFGREHMNYWSYDEVKEVDWITGCSLMFRKEILDKVGFLDENYFMYSEDCDFCYRLKKEKLKTIFYPYASLVHYGGQSSLLHNYQKVHSKTITRYLFKSRYYFFRKHYGRERELLLKIMYIIYFSISLLKNIIMFIKKNRQERISSAKTILHSVINKY